MIPLSAAIALVDPLVRREPLSWCLDLEARAVVKVDNQFNQSGRSETQTPVCFREVMYLPELSLNPSRWIAGQFSGAAMW